MIIAVILRLMMLTVSLLLLIGSAFCFRSFRDWWYDGDRLMAVTDLLIALLVLLLAALGAAIALFVDFC